MKILAVAIAIMAFNVQAFNLPVVGIGSSGSKHEAFENMMYWCDLNKGKLEGYICRRANQNNCISNTYVCSGVCVVGEDRVSQETFEDYLQY